MKYELRWISTDGKSGRWTGPFATRQEAEEHAALRQMENGLRYTVEEVPEPGSTAAHHVDILRDRVKELEALVEERGKAVTDAHAANYAMHRDLAFAIQACDAMREAMRTGEWRAGHDRGMANSAIAGWDRWKASLAASPQGTAKASEAPGEGGDSDRRRLEALRAFLDGDDAASLTWHEGEFHAVAEDVAITAPTLLALADKLAEKEDKP